MIHNLLTGHTGRYYCVSTGGFAAALIRLGTRNHWNHCGIVGVNVLVEAQPREGVTLAPKSKYDDSDDIIVNDEDPLSGMQSAAITATAAALAGTPYNFLDIAALALYSAGVKLRWLKKRVLREDRMICSQFVAACYASAGIVLVPGKTPQEVTPGDLSNRIARGA